MTYDRRSILDDPEWRKKHMLPKLGDSPRNDLRTMLEFANRCRPTPNEVDCIVDEYLLIWGDPSAGKPQGVINVEAGTAQQHRR